MPPKEESEKLHRDLLSGMPDGILHHILSFLPTRQSVRTSVLSRRWRHHWRCVPTLYFDCATTVDDYDGYDELMAIGGKMAYAIDRFLARRDASSSLLRFHLPCLLFDDRPLGNPVIDWIRYARSHGVRDMALGFSWMQEPLPLSIFCDLPSVEVLNLQSFSYSAQIIGTLPQHIALSKLKVLTLGIPMDPLSTILSSCSALQELTLYRGMDKALEIALPNLRCLTIIDDNRHHHTSCQVGITCPRLEYLHLSSAVPLEDFQGHMPSLREAFVFFLYHPWVEPFVCFQQIFMSLHGVTKLTLHLRVGLGAKCRLKQTRDCPIFNQMKQFTFMASFRKSYLREVLLDFLLQSPNLFSLNLIDDTKDLIRDRAEVGKHEVRIRATLITLHHLKTVSVEGIRDDKTRRDVLKMLSMHVSEWERVVLIS